MSELARQIERYLEELERGGASPHTVAAYAADLRQFLEFLSPPEMEPPAPGAIDVLMIREWLAALYRMKLEAVSIRRKLAAVRGLFRFLLREGIVPVNVGAPGAHAQGPQEAAGSDDARASQHADRRRRRRTSWSARFRRATAPFSSCSTAAVSA